MNDRTNSAPAPREERPARPGEVCSCGRPAAVLLGERETPWCGVPSEDDPARERWERTAESGR